MYYSKCFLKHKYSIRIINKQKKYIVYDADENRHEFDFEWQAKAFIQEIEEGTDKQDGFYR